MAPHFLPPRNGGKNREGLRPFEPLWFPTSARHPLPQGAAGLRRKAAKRRLATEQLAIFDCETVPVRWGTALRKFANSTEPLNFDFPVRRTAKPGQILLIGKELLGFFYVYLTNQKVSCETFAL